MSQKADEQGTPTTQGGHPSRSRGRLGEEGADHWRGGRRGILYVLLLHCYILTSLHWISEHWQAAKMTQTRRDKLTKTIAWSSPPAAASRQWSLTIGRLSGEWHCQMLALL